MNRRKSEKSAPWRFGTGVATFACALLGVVLMPGTSAAQQAPAPTTSLGTMVVTPLRTNAPYASTRTTKIQRSSLNLQMQTGLPVQRGALPPPSANRKSPPAQPLPHPKSQPKPIIRTPPRALRIVPPKYPGAAAAQHLRGSVTVGFTIEADGRTARIHILSATTRNVFNQATREAVRQWRFRPATENGKPVARTVSQTIVFNPPVQQTTLPQPPPTPKLAQTQAAPPKQASAKSVPVKIQPTHIVAPAYPPKAYRQGIGGAVTVQFTVGTDGRPRHIRVIQATPQGLFNEAAKQAVRKWRFQPIETPTKITQTIHFTPPG
ncbi:MAG: energy transducer TonB [Gammaproteobacteria bacterium]